MRVLITGATGTLGLALADTLGARGDEVVALSRDPERGQRVLGEGVEVHAWPEPTQAPPPARALGGVEAIVHLLGEPVAQRWTGEARTRIRESRVLGTRMLVQAVRDLPAARRPKALISQSATGYYGPRGDAPLDEHASAGDDFLAQVVVAWEAEATEAQSMMRVALTRTGVVLSPEGGALAKMLPFFKLGVGGPVAGGQQYVPWIHRDDVVGALICCVDDTTADGPVNLTAPNPVTNTELSRALGRALGRPAVLPVPAFAIKLLYGDMAEMVTTGQRAVPARLRQLGYEFHHPEVEPALRDVLSGQ
ncbi:MAG: TIGR01777 family oxidoreductase [Actinomycetota bacterium]|nr:TIGR01777 family oxidoreductase [Actinomycetota bacterium]